MRLNDFQLTENFNLKEFECPCCHTVLLHPLLVLKLQNLREKWGSALIINSGYRCEIHNREVGGVIRSLHKVGQAADVRVPNAEHEKFRVMALGSGFTKVLCYGSKNFVHIQIGD